MFENGTLMIKITLALADLEELVSTGSVHHLFLALNSNSLSWKFSAG